jgi:hexosaminidase
MNLNLLPCPRSLKTLRGTFTLPKQVGTLRRGVRFIKFIRTSQRDVPTHPEGYALTISKSGIEIQFRESGGLRAAMATLRQIVRECSRGTDPRSVKSQARTPVPLKLPCLKIRDWPDFARRGVMLDISRGRVPKLETLLELIEHLADFKINELQLYTEHTFAYRKYKSIWQNWGALTGKEIRKLNRRCRELGIDLVPNQNSFGHLRYFLENPELKKLGEVSEPYEGGVAASSPDGDGGVAATSFLRRPTTLAPNHPGTLPFLRWLYDELLPNFTSRLFNVGCDETWDLGRGQSKKLCAIKGQGRVYLDFLKKIHREVCKHGRQMMFWGDIILKYPRLIKELPRDAIALNWGYETNHPFNREARLFAKSGISFYVCPGTSTWQTLIGRHDNALANLRAAANAGRKHGAIGYLITDWGDGGHPQPLAVSYLPFLAGASLAWNVKNFDERKLVSILGRDVFENIEIARAAFELGFIHKRLGVVASNETPLGTVIAASPAEKRELFCRNGLKWFRNIPEKNIRITLSEIEAQLVRLGRARVSTKTGEILRRELALAARMAAQSCKFMLWQQMVAARKNPEAKHLAQTFLCELAQLEKDFNALWPLRNKATPKQCSAFLRWRMRDYRRGFVAPAQ